MEQQNNTVGTGLMDKVRNSATSQLDAQKTRATDGLGTVAQAVRQTTQQLRDQQHDTIAQYVEQAATQLERFASSLKEKNVNDLFTDAQDLARRRPAVFIGSAFALGLFGARFIKSSSARSHGNGRWSASTTPALATEIGRS